MKKIIIFFLMFYFIKTVEISHQTYLGQHCISKFSNYIFKNDSCNININRANIDKYYYNAIINGRYIDQPCQNRDKNGKCQSCGTRFNTETNTCISLREPYNYSYKFNVYSNEFRSTDFIIYRQHRSSDNCNNESLKIHYSHNCVGRSRGNSAHISCNSNNQVVEEYYRGFNCLGEPINTFIKKINTCYPPNDHWIFHHHYECFNKTKK